MNNLSNVKVGQRVYCLLNGYGTVHRIVAEDSYPIRVKFTALDESYSVEGKLFHYSENRSLYLDKPEIIEPPAPILTKLIHGVEVPDISFTPKTNDIYYFPTPNTDYLQTTTRYCTTSSSDKHRSDHGMCYPCTEKGREAAILHAKAMLGASP